MKDTVAAFDSFVGVYVEQLVKRVPMTPARRSRLDKRFHNLQAVAADLSEIFGISILGGLEPDEIEFAKLMFHRRHVYEHLGGEADDKYISNSGDKDVRIKQALRETIQSAHRIVGIVQKMAASLHRGFHEIFPVEERLINRYHEQRTAR